MGAAKFIRGLARHLDQRRLDVIVNTGDDENFYGLHVSPDIDTIIYTLAGAVNRVQGWGLAEESFVALEALTRFYGEPWFKLGDRDIATHLFRTERLRERASLSEVTAELAERFGVGARVMPMSDDRVRTFVKVRGKSAMPFQEYFVRRRFRGVVERIELRGIERARALASALESIANAAAVILAPSNPFVSLGPILGLKGMRKALSSVRARVAAISPIVAGRTIKGPADRMLRGLGHEVSPLGVARLYRDCVGVFVLDRADQRYAGAIEELGMRAVVSDTIMSTPARAARLSKVVLDALGV
ncbi:MAG TPA: 2-phospho-L-lactate transferase [Candidatus Binataceae bacterium]|nr:2-phospho-L-lactate transferase [Candidatus Binataceae bacterium]